MPKVPMQAIAASGNFRMVFQIVLFSPDQGCGVEPEGSLPPPFLRGPPDVMKGNKLLHMCM